MIKFQAIPLRAHHVGQRLVPQRLRGEHDGALAALRDVVFVDVEGEFDDRAQGPGQMRLDVHRIHVVVFGKRQQEIAESPRDCCDS